MNTVGSLLKEQREAKGFTIDDVVKGTKIQKIYIDAIEQGDFSFFKNQEFYQQVFVGSYADFLGINKNELLVQLQDDVKNYVPKPRPEFKRVNEAEDPKPTSIVSSASSTPEPEVVVEEVVNTPEVEEVVEETITEEVIQPEVVEETFEAPTPEPEVAETVEVPEEVNPTTQINPGQLKKFLQDYEVKSEEVDPVVESAQVNDEIIEQESKSDITNDEINQLIDEINQNVEVDLGEYFEADGETLAQPVADLEPAVSSISSIKSDDVQSDENEKLNLSLLEEIQKINDEVESVKEAIEKEDEEIPTIHVNQNNNFFNRSENDQLGSTAVIDLTSGIEIEKIQKELEEEPVEEPQVLEEIVVEDVEVETPTTVEEITKQDGGNVLAELEKNMPKNDGDPSKTSMNFKVAKALGDSKVEVDEADAKKIKRDRIIDILLMIFIIALLCVLGYMAWNTFIVG